MDTFSFPYHRVRTQYPKSSDSIKLGGSYDFVSAPVAPDQRTFVLVFPTMKYYTNSDGTVDTLTSPEINYRVFQQFYEAHRLYQQFIYPHPVLGNLTVRFSKPLQDPDGIPGGAGALQQFEVELIECP